MAPLFALWFLLAIASLVTLFFIPAPYGRYADRTRGPLLPARWAWMAMEAPAVLAFALALAAAGPEAAIDAWVLTGFWMLHYLDRAFLYPFRIAPGARAMPLAIAGLGCAFNCVNGTLNGRGVVAEARGGASWLADPRFLGGALLFVAGWLANRWADRTLRALRGPGESGYRIPQGGLFRWVSCPNYLAECVQWIGWAVMSWSLAGAAFALWTLANLVPRARAHHRWYRARFADYPPERRALLPGIW